MPKQPQTPKEEDFGFIPDANTKIESSKEDFGFVPDSKSEGPTLNYKGKQIPIMAGVPTAALVPEELGAGIIGFIKNLVGTPSNVGSTGGILQAARAAVPEVEGAGLGSAIKRKLFEKAKEYGPTALAIEGGRRAVGYLKDTLLE